MLLSTLLPRSQGYCELPRDRSYDTRATTVRPVDSAHNTTAVLVLGAGMTGLTAALALAEAGRSVLIVDKGRSVGGRMATRRIGPAVLDHGAQFFTVRSDDFAAAVRMWAADGIVDVWANGFGDDPDGHPRYRVTGGLSQLAKHLAAACRREGAEVVVNQRMDAVIDTGDALTCTYAGGTRMPDDVESVVLTAPVPQCRVILRNGGIAVHGDLNSVVYDPVIALLVTGRGDTGGLGPAGARQSPDGPVFTFVADNHVKGISPVTAITAHAAPGVSASLWELDDTSIADRLVPDLVALLGDFEIDHIQVKKWRYAAPRRGLDQRYIQLPHTSSPVYVAGDAFGGAKLEGAFLSGRAVAEAVLSAR